MYSHSFGVLFNLWALKWLQRFFPDFGFLEITFFCAGWFQVFILFHMRISELVNHRFGAIDHFWWSYVLYIESGGIPFTYGSIRADQLWSTLFWIVDSNLDLTVYQYRVNDACFVPWFIRSNSLVLIACSLYFLFLLVRLKSYQCSFLSCIFSVIHFEIFASSFCLI